VLRSLRGETIDALSRTLKLAVAGLSERRVAVLAGCEANVASRDAHAGDEDPARLIEALGPMKMQVELQRDGIRRLKAGFPLDETAWPK
jgi:hypothetical protein